MQLDKLQLALRPRPANQALDLGYALLHAHAAPTYAAWLALWLPLMALCTALAFWLPAYYPLWLFLAWWLRPLPERAPLYVLSRRVFGENVSWREAVKAWPSQWRGGWFSMLTWRRLISPARSFYTPVWQLEGARGKVSGERRRVLGRNGTSGSAMWFGACCLLFELGLAFGLLGFISVFLSQEQVVNPFRLFADLFRGVIQGPLLISLLFGGYALAGAIVGPVYVACGFTLYLNRRATLEAWDLEIALRQIQPPRHVVLPAAEGGAAEKGATVTAVLACLMAAGALLLPPAPAQAAPASAAAAKECKPPQFVQDRAATRAPAADADQEARRQALQKIYDSDDLRGYTCNDHLVWTPSPDETGKAPAKPFSMPALDDAALVLKLLVIALAIIVICVLAWRFRDSFPGFAMPGKKRLATEVAGLDIRPESLPDDVPAQVLSLWRAGERRRALALLYRATISRLVHDNGLAINTGATEGDCARLAERAARTQALSEGRLHATRLATELWLRAAYAARWPEESAVIDGCRLWGGAFDGAQGGN